jgi:hypothetical protein
LNKLYNAAFAVMCAQPLTYGHINLLTKMASCSKRPVILWGSCQTENVPERVFLSFEDRKKCVDNIFGLRFEHVYTEDIGATSQEEWLLYLAKEIQSQQGFYPFTEDNVYFGGSEDVHWYKQKIYEHIIKGRIEQFIGFKNIIPLDRSNVPTSGTQVRKMLENYVLGLDLDNPEWKAHTPPCNWELIEQAYRKKFERN